MAQGYKASGKAATMAGGLAAGGAIGLVITLLGCGMLALAVDREMLAWDRIGYGVMVVLFIASVLGAMVANGRIKRRRLLVCTMSALLYWVELMAITALFFGGRYEAVGATAGMITAGSGCVFLLGMHEKRGGKRHKKYNGHR